SPPSQGGAGGGSFRARLEEYARRGGVIVALAQQHGYEYAALPGASPLPGLGEGPGLALSAAEGVRAYGWSEDNSCFRASLYLSQWHPILSGIPRATLDAHVDGYFTSVPTDTQVLLSRTANGMPAAILYPYGAGYVFAMTLYDDWGAGHGQSSADARTLLRDLLTWAIDDEGEPEGGLPRFAPQTPISLTIPLTNATPYTATGVALRVVDPARQVVLTATLPITIGPGRSALLQQTLPPTTTLGIWRVDAQLLGHSGARITDYAQAARFVVANPAEPVDLAPQLSLRITAPSEHIVVNTETTFAFIVRNRSPVTQTVELRYWLPHHKWKTGDASYGDSSAPNRQILSVAPHSEAIYRWPRLIRITEPDRLWARLVRDGRVVAESHFAVYGRRGSVSLRPTLHPSQVQRTETALLTVGLSNPWGGPFTTTLHIRALDSARTFFHTATLTAPVAGGWTPEPITHTFAVPASAAAGSGLVLIEARSPEGRTVGGAFVPFSVPASPLAFSLLSPPPLEGDSAVSLGLVVTNTSPSLPVERGILTLTLSLPPPRGKPEGGTAVTPTASTSFTLAPSSSTVLSLPLALPPLAFGPYTLTIETADEYGERRADILWSATPLVEGRLDRPSYRARGVAHLDLRLVNPGPFLLPLTATLVADLPFSSTRAMTLESFTAPTLTWEIPIPADVAAGRYPLTLALALPGGDEWIRQVAVVEIPPPAVTTSVAPHSVAAGETVSVTLANTGGADTTTDYTLRVVDARGQTVVSATVAAAPIRAGESMGVPLVLPAQAAGGPYTLLGTLTDRTSGARQDLFIPLQVTGTAAALAVATDRPEYLTSDVLTLTAAITNGTYPLEGGALTWRVTQPAGVYRHLEPEFVTYTVANSGLIKGNINAIAVDGQENVWFAAEPRWDDDLQEWVGGGVGVRLANGTWLTYTAANSPLPSDGVDAVAVDGQGNVWVATEGGVNARLTSGEWLTYTMDNSGLNSPYITDIAADGAGNVWFATEMYWDEAQQGTVGGGLSVRLTCGDWVTYATANSGLPSDNVYVVAVDGEGNVWTAGDWPGLSVRLPDGSWRQYGSAHGLNDPVTAIAVAPDGTRWAGTPGRTVALSGPLVALSPWQTYVEPFTTNGLDEITAIAIDPAGNRWFAAGQQGEGYTAYLYRLSADESVWDTFFAGWSRIEDLAVDGTGTAWLIAGGVWARDANGDWTQYTPESTGGGLVSGNVHGVTVDGQGNVWFAARPTWEDVGGGVSVRLTDGAWISYTAENSGLPSNQVRAIAVDSAGNAWFALGPPWWQGEGEGISARLANGTWITYTRANSPLPSDDVRALTVDATGNAWFATAPYWDEERQEEVGASLSVRRTDGTWVVYTPTEEIPTCYATAMAVRRDGEVWLACEHWGEDAFRGLVSLSPATGEFVTHTITSTHGGLLSDEITDMMTDGMGDLWMAHGWPAGLSRYSGLTRVLWQSTLPLHLAGGESRAVTLSLPASALGTTGRMLLEGEVQSATGQRLAFARQPFAVYAADAPALSLGVSPAVAAPGTPLTLQGALRNGSPLTLTGQVVTLTLGGQFVAAVGPLDLAPGESRLFSVTAVAPTASTTPAFLWAEATDGTRAARDRLTLSAPALTATVNAPDTVGRKPFDLIVSLTNPSLLDLLVQSAICNSQSAICNRQSATIPAGETRTLHETYAIAADTTFTLTLTGAPSAGSGQAFTHTLVVPVLFGEAATAAFTPDLVYPEGPIAIPYIFTNTGQLPVEFTTAVTITDLGFGVRDLEFDTYLPLAETISGTLLFALPVGDYTLTYATPFGTGHAAFRVAPPETAELAATLGPRDGGILTVTAVVTNTGFHPISGTLRLEAPFYSTDLPLSASPGLPVSCTLPLDTSTAEPGVHTATITLLSAGGLPLASTAVTFTVPGADLVLTTVPTDTLVRTGEWVTLTFGLANRGSAPATGVLTVTVGELLDQVQSLWLPGGAEGTLPFAFRAPDGLAGSDLLCTYEFAGARHDFLLPIAGVDLDVEAGWDAPAYTPGATATLRLTVTHRGAAPTPPLYAHVNPPNGQPITHTLALAPGETAVLDFPFPAADGLVFYGIYEEREQRGVSLNTTYLRVLNPDITLIPDRTVYRPGDTVHVTVYGPPTGTLAIAAPGFTTTLQLDSCPPPPAPCFQFTLPLDLLRGTHTLDYTLDGGLPHSTPFDVDAPWVRVTEARLLDLPYAPGDTVRADLTVASTDPLTVALHAWILYPDGTRNTPYAIRPTSLQAILNNHLTLTLPLSTTQAGPHRLVYTLADPADPDRIYAAGSEAFDVGAGMFLGLHTDRAEYPDPTAPVIAHALILAYQATGAQLTLSLDGTAGWDHPVTLLTGTHVYTFSLPLPIRPGYHDLHATLAVSGLRHATTTSFAYGTDAADLTVSPPRLLAPSAGPTRTVELVVANQGRFPSTPTTVRIWDGGVETGTPLAELPLPALDAGRVARIPFVWDITGQGGLHTLHAVVDPDDGVGEWYEENNRASAEIALPSFALEVEASRSAWMENEPVSVTIRASNLLRDEAISLVVMGTLERAGWPPGLSQTTTLTLEPLAQETREFSWDTGNLPAGFYTVRVRGTAGGEALETAIGLWLYRPADFTADPLTGTAPLRVSFTDLSVAPGPITLREWDFGDGSPVVTGSHPVHVYILPGQYTVTLTTTVGISTYVKSRPNYITVLPVAERHFLYLPLMVRGSGG
ncbi:MAG: CARDB domain-containing protein, partial [Anaerolineae bacterium]